VTRPGDCVRLNRFGVGDLSAKLDRQARALAEERVQVFMTGGEKEGGDHKWIAQAIARGGLGDFGGGTRPPSNGKGGVAGTMENKRWERNL